MNNDFFQNSVISKARRNSLSIDPHEAPDDLLRELTRNSYEIVKAKYKAKGPLKSGGSGTLEIE